jgi:hypothetical protein
MFKNLLTVSLVAVGLSGVAGCAGDDAVVDPCPTGGMGTVEVTYTGLPAGIEGHVMLFLRAVFHDGIAPGTLTGIEAGPWDVAVIPVASPDPRIRTAYTATVQSICVRAGATTPLTVAWVPIPTSHRLWATNGSGGTGDLLGFTSEDLAASGAPNPQDLVAPTGGDIAFEQDGSFWAFGASTSDAMLGHYDAFSLGATATPDLEIDVNGIDCFPHFAAMTFGPGGDLWASSPCANRVVQLPLGSLTASGTVLPNHTLTGTTSPSGLAFDLAGNLWVADEGGVLHRFDAASLLTSELVSPALSLTVKQTSDPLDTSTLRAADLAFDADGNLWGSEFGGNIFFAIDAADLTASGAADVVPTVQVTVPLRALLEGMAFDEEGGLWTTYGSGQLARLSPAQLLVSSDAGSPTVPATIIESADIGYLGGVAIYPAPAALPLYHSLP